MWISIDDCNWHVAVLAGMADEVRRALELVAEGERQVFT